MVQKSFRAVDTLTKIADQRLRKQQQRLAPIQEKIQTLEEQIAYLRDKKAKERAYSDLNPLSSIDYLRYAEGIDADIQKNYGLLQDQEKLLKIEQDRLSKLFQEKKVLEVYKDRKIQEAVEAEDRQLQASMDELAIQRYRGGD